MERNKCWAQYRCPARCCYDSSMVLHESEFDELFRPLTSTQIDILSLEEMAVNIEFDPKAQSEIFWALNELVGTIEMQFKGPCPYLDIQSNSCTIYSRRPEACRNFKRGGMQCIAIQLRPGP